MSKLRFIIAMLLASVSGAVAQSVFLGHTPQHLIIFGSKPNAGTPLVDINLETGEVIFGPEYDLGEVQKTFWRSLARPIRAECFQ